MADYYRRQFEFLLGDDPTSLDVFIAATNERQFRIAFNVVIDFNESAAYADIAIFGLSRSTESKVFKRFQSIALRAGYENNIDFIFRGQVINILRERVGPDRITRIIARSSARKLIETSLSGALGAGATVLDAIKFCALTLGLSLIINPDKFVKKFSRGYSLNGDPRNYLDRLGRSFNFKWTVDGDRLVVVPNNESRGGTTHVISALTGMVGSPEITGGGNEVETGANVTVKLNPAIKIGEKIVIDSEYKQANFGDVFYSNIPETLGAGNFTVIRIEHEGDSYSDAWDTRLICSKWSLS